MTSPETIKKIVEYGVMAPSGDNCQPWRFVVRGNELSVYLIPERDQSLYSSGNRASYFAHGALLENISIAASGMDVAVAITVFPDIHDATLVAKCVFNASTNSRDPLFQYITKRVTNRKPYNKNPLTAEQRAALESLSKNQLFGARLTITEDPIKQKAIGYAGSVNEEMLFGTERMHSFFFSHINWTREEDAKKSIGFYIDTLELPAPAKPMFKIMKRWWAAKVLGVLGLPKQIANGNAKNVYTTGAAHGAVSVRGTTPEDFVRAGQLMERVWLTVTSLGLQLQPLAGITFLMQGIDKENAKFFTNDQIKKIKEAYATMKTEYGLTTDQTLVMAFRIGTGPAPSAHASRLPPQIIFN